jgi:DNA-binding CsgD family transcriptional regulator
MRLSRRNHHGHFVSPLLTRDELERSDTLEIATMKRERSPSPPRGIVGARLEASGDELAVLSFPIQGGRVRALTFAEHDVAQRLLAGHSNARIARERGTSERTVANQVASILKKLRVRSRSELVAARALFRS